MLPVRSGVLWLAISLFLYFIFPAPAQPATNQLRPWLDYRTIMWVGDSVLKRPEKTALFYQRLREMGINTAMVYGDSNPQPLVENHFPYYVENLVNRGLCLKFNSNVRDWDKFVTDWAKTGRPESALVRDYCLDDPQWRDSASKEVHAIAAKNRDHSPLAYNLRDELSVTYSANPFDYDFSPAALSHFREWLKTQYHDLAALNAEWETDLKSWDEIKPFTTDQIKNRMASGDRIPCGKPDWQAVQALKFAPSAAAQSPTRWNFSPWADFRTYMDRSLADALNALRTAAHESDPHTPVGIEGTQMPDTFGGYDLWRLSQVLDWIEPYDIGNTREILGSFMPGKPIVTTVFESTTDAAKRRLWHLLLEGDRGCLVWWSEDCIDWKSDDYALTPKAKALAPVLKEMTSPLAQLFLRAERVRDPIYIHYSQPSIQVDWLIESTVDGSTWLRRFSSYEAEHNHQAKVRDAWLKAFQDLGFSPQFISSEQIEQGGLPNSGNAVLVMPASWALSEMEAGEIKKFLAPVLAAKLSRKLFCDGIPGQFDEHGKLRGGSPLQNLFSTPSPEPACYAASGNGSSPGLETGDIATHASDRLKADPKLNWPNWIHENFGSIVPPISLPANSCTRIHRFRIPRGQLVAFERNIEYQMSEDLKQAGGNEALEKPTDLDATLAQPAHIYDLRTQKYLGHTDKLHFTLNPWEPSFFALTTKKLPQGGVVELLSKPVNEAK